MIFEKNINKVLDEYKGLFSCIVVFEFDTMLRSNQHILNIQANDDFVLDNFENFKIVENFARQLIKLHYFKKLVFLNVFPDIDDTQTCDVWPFRLAKQLRRRKGIGREGSHLVIVNYN